MMEVEQVAGEAAAGGDTLLTAVEKEVKAPVSPEAENTVQKAAPEVEAKKETGEEKAVEVPESPQAYGLRFEPNTVIDTELLGNFQNAAFELGINKTQAQKLADLYAGHVAKISGNAEKMQQESVLAERKAWEAELAKSPAFEEEKQLAKKTLRVFAPPDENGNHPLYDVMRKTNVGSNPEMFKFMVAVGKSLAEPGFKGESVSQREKTAAEVLYPSHSK